MKESINLAWCRDEDDENLSSLPMHYVHIENLFEEVDSYLPILLQEIEDDGKSSFLHLSKEIENSMSLIRDFVTYTSVWHGRVLKNQRDTVLARISQEQEDEKEFYVEIVKSKLEKTLQEQMIPGALFDWSFGYRGESCERIWKIELQQSQKPTPEAIQKIVARMTAGFEHYYDDKD